MLLEKALNSRHEALDPLKRWEQADDPSMFAELVADNFGV